MKLMKKLWFLGFGFALFNSAFAAVQEIDMSSMTLTPAAADVNQGDTVRWINRDTVPHKIKGSFGGSANINPGESYEFVFTSAGNFDYICELHPSMTGTVNVAAVTTVDDEFEGILDFEDLFGSGDLFETEDLAKVTQIEAPEAQPEPAVMAPPTPVVVTPPAPAPVVNTATINSAPQSKSIAQSASGESLPTAGVNPLFIVLGVFAFMFFAFSFLGFNKR